MAGWIGVDLDGTLAHYDHWRGEQHIGEPIPLMVERIRCWLDEGMEVRIFTARACGANRQEVVLPAIEQWCLKHIGVVLPVTNQKDYEMEALWDDRCVQVETNTGRRIEDDRAHKMSPHSRQPQHLIAEIQRHKRETQLFERRKFSVTRDEIRELGHYCRAFTPANGLLWVGGPRPPGVLGEYDGVLLMEKSQNPQSEQEEPHATHGN